MLILWDRGVFSCCKAHPENICIDRPPIRPFHSPRLSTTSSLGDVSCGPRAKLGPVDLFSTGAGLRADQSACRVDSDVDSQELLELEVRHISAVGK